MFHCRRTIVRWLRTLACELIAYCRGSHQTVPLGANLASSILRAERRTVPTLAPRVDCTLVKAISRAFRWQKMLDTDQYVSISEIAKTEKINAPYVSRVLRLTLLAPVTVEAVLGGRHPTELTLAGTLKLFPVGWSSNWTGYRVQIKRRPPPPPPPPRPPESRIRVGVAKPRHLRPRLNFDAQGSIPTPFCTCRHAGCLDH